VFILQGIHFRSARRVEPMRSPARRGKRECHEQERTMSGEGDARGRAPSHPGGTGEQVSGIGLRGWHLGVTHVDEALAIRLVRSAIDPRGACDLFKATSIFDGAASHPAWLGEEPERVQTTMSE
jgi:hypothetical protein